MARHAVRDTARVERLRLPRSWANRTLCSRCGTLAVCCALCTISRWDPATHEDRSRMVCERCLASARTQRAQQIHHERLVDRDAYCSRRAGFYAQVRRLIIKAAVHRQGQADYRRWRDTRATWTAADRAAHEAQKMARHAARERTDRISRRSIKPRRRMALAERFNRTCTYCGRTSESPLCDPDGHTWEIDHYMPLAHGGAHSGDNLRLACRSCNRHKSDKLYVHAPRTP